MTTDLSLPSKNQGRPSCPSGNCVILPFPRDPQPHAVVRALDQPLSWERSAEKVANGLLKILIQEKNDHQLRRLSREHIQSPRWMERLLRGDDQAILFTVLPLDREQLKKQIGSSLNHDLNFRIVAEAAQQYVNENPKIQEILQKGLASFSSNLTHSERKDLRGRLQDPNFTLHYQKPKESLSKTK